MQCSRRSRRMRSIFGSFVIWGSVRTFVFRCAGVTAFSMVGAIIVASPDLARDATTANAHPHALLGDALSLVGAATAATYFVIGRRLRSTLDLWAYVGLASIAGESAGYTDLGGFEFYGRVAQFADCSKFKPPGRAIVFRSRRRRCRSARPGGQAAITMLSDKRNQLHGAPD